MRPLAPLAVLAFLLVVPATDALAAPYLGFGIATQGSRDRMEDHQPFVEMVCATAGTLHRVRVTLSEGAPGDTLAVVFRQDAAPDAIARVGLGETVTVHAFKGHCGVEDAFVVEGAQVQAAARYQVEISRGCYLSVEDCEAYVWD